MTIKVLIKRKIPEKLNDELNILFAKMRYTAMQQHGYIGGETLRKINSPDDYLIISRWQDIDDWSRWLVSDERREIQERIDSLIDAETKFEIYTND